MFDTKPHYVNNLSSGVIKILDDHKDDLPEIIKQVYLHFLIINEIKCYLMFFFNSR